MASDAKKTVNNASTSNSVSSTSSPAPSMSVDKILSTFSPDTTAAMTSNALNSMIVEGKTIDYHRLPVRQLIIMLDERRLVPSFKDSLVILLLKDDERYYRASRASTNSTTIRPVVVVDGQRNVSRELGDQATLDELEEAADRYLERREGSEDLRSLSEKDLPILPANSRQ